MSAQQVLRVWFGRCGRPIDADDRALVQAWVDACGSSCASIRFVAGWREAAAWLRECGFVEGFWPSEERLRLALRDEAAGRLGEAELLERLSQATVPITDALHEAAVASAARESAADEGLVRAAAGAAALAEHQRALAQLAGAPAAHPFFCKHRLFAHGRWPLGVFDDAGRAVVAIL